MKQVLSKNLYQSLMTMMLLYVVISLGVFIPYFIGKLMLKWTWFANEVIRSDASAWGAGFLVILAVGTGLIILFLVVVIIVALWELSGRISNKKKKKPRNKTRTTKQIGRRKRK